MNITESEKRIKRPTITDIAKASNVSPATVSFVISERPGIKISKETRERVLKTARDLGYTRNSLAVSLRIGRTNTLAIVCPIGIKGVGAYQEETYLNDSMIALSLAVSQSDMNALLFMNDGVNELHPRELADRRVDGALILCASEDPAWVEAVRRIGLPYVEICSAFGKYQVHSADYEGMREATDYLIGLGHKRIAHWLGPQYMFPARGRLAGFQDAMKAIHAGEQDTPLVSNDEEFVSLISGPSRPTAVVCCSDALAFKALNLALEQGLLVPKDLSIIGFDNDLRSICTLPSLTTVYNPIKEMAQEAVQLLRAQINNEPIGKEVIYVPTQLIIRNSTAPPE